MKLIEDVTKCIAVACLMPHLLAPNPTSSHGLLFRRRGFLPSRAQRQADANMLTLKARPLNLQTCSQSLV